MSSSNMSYIFSTLEFVSNIAYAYKHDKTFVASIERDKLDAEKVVAFS